MECSTFTASSFRIWNSSTGIPSPPLALEKVSFHSNPKERQCKRMLKLLHNCTHLTRCKVMLKILQARLPQYMNRELPDVQAGFRKGIGIRDQTANIHWIIAKAREFQKNICFIHYSKVFGNITNCGKFLKRWKYQITWPASWDICMQVSKQQLELDMEQLVPNRKRSTSRLYIVTLLI